MPKGALRLMAIALAANFLSVSATIAQPANIAMLKGDERQATLVKGAAAEGKVLFYSGWVADQVLRPMGAAFHSAYPSVEIEFVTGNNRLLFQKLVTEGRAGVTVADVRLSLALGSVVVGVLGWSIAHAPGLEWERWTGLQRLAKSMLQQTESPTDTDLPALEYHQTKRVDHQLVLRRH